MTTDTCRQIRAQKIEYQKKGDYYFVSKDATRLQWLNIVIYTIGHLLYALSFWHMYHPCNWSMTNAKSVIHVYVLGTLTGLGITAGAHRLWSHRSYNATFGLRCFLMICHTLAGQGTILFWAIVHRVHHKSSDSEADPHNIKRGIFFAHMGWIFVPRHPEYRIMARKMNITDLENDPVVMFQKRHYAELFILTSFLIPILISHQLLGETLWRSFLIIFIHRYFLSLHTTWLVNSAAHMFGDHPYDPSIAATENSFVSLAAMGEGYHNFHHTFPYDYRTSEDGMTFNLTRFFLDGMAALGFAYGLKTASDETVSMRKQQTERHGA